MPCYEREQDLPEGYVFESTRTGYASQQECEENCPTCTQLGACCKQDGTCEVNSGGARCPPPSADETVGARRYFFAGSGCDEVYCKGACCQIQSDGSILCSETVLADCSGTNDVWRQFVRCSSDPCADCVCYGFCWYTATCRDPDGCNTEPGQACGEDCHYDFAAGEGFPVMSREECLGPDDIDADVFNWDGCGSFCDGNVYYSACQGLYFKVGCQASAELAANEYPPAICGVPGDPCYLIGNTASSQAVSVYLQSSEEEKKKILKQTIKKASSHIIEHTYKDFHELCQKYNIPLDIADYCVIKDHEDKQTVLVNSKHSCYPREYPPDHIFKKIKAVKNSKKTNKQKVTTGGPGTELKALLKSIGITASENCSCNAKAIKMDQWGCDKCEQEIDTIVVWLKEEAKKRRLPFVDLAGKLLIKRAIRNARKKGFK